MQPTADVLIIGAGLSGLAAATFLKHKEPDISLLIIEQGDHPGGAVHSHIEEGYLAEGGAHGFLDNALESRVLVHEAGLTEEVEKAPLSEFVRYICLNGKLNLIPQSPGKVLKAPLVPLTGKLRVLADLWKKPLPDEPTVAQWVEHRFGKSLLPFADAVFTGTYAGDIERLKLEAVMPGLHSLEQDHGSVLKGAVHKMRVARKESRKQGKKKGKKGLPAMTSFKSGMSRLPQAMAAKLIPNKEIMYRTAARSIAEIDGGWSVKTGQLELQAKHLIVALPVNRCLELLANSELPAPPVTAIPEARIATVALGFTDTANVPFGFGYLAPEQEERFALGALFSSHMFPGRAPAGHVLMEALVGGRRHPERLELADEELVAKVYEDLKQLIDLPDPPVFSRVLRPKYGIPQLEVGYPALLEWRKQQHASIDNLHLCGFGWQGIGINDMHKQAWEMAKRILAGYQEEQEDEVKGVYF
ncbi:protoporphyrinogen oxidase [Candidatus Electrothrix aarhusensis]|jgi:oxygen-dependent protoporphyrinogen oxidase|uniref:Coproporphyrinogen III oxidase n=1 Tax=Candidatus Electrothrix aarhusensis TaxID=1859131 RepID=A0A3S3SPW8_9BACT|nr:protoporphyrinogen oxidase [Candidatus Electrothrix aarhusensis]